MGDLPLKTASLAEFCICQHSAEGHESSVIDECEEEWGKQKLAMVNGERAVVALPTGNHRPVHNAFCRADDRTPIG